MCSVGRSEAVGLWEWETQFNSPCTGNIHAGILQSTVACVFPSRSALLGPINPPQATAITGSHCTIPMLVWSYTADSARRTRQLLQGHRAPWGEKQGCTEPQTNQFVQEFSVTKCLSHCVQPCRARDQSCQINLLTWGRGYSSSVSLHLHMQSWRVTLVNGADSSSQFQFAVLQYNWLPLNTLWARAARSAPSPLLIFLHTPWHSSSFEVTFPSLRLKTSRKFPFKIHIL